MIIMKLMPMANQPDSVPDSVLVKAHTVAIRSVEVFVLQVRKVLIFHLFLITISFRSLPVAHKAVFPAILTHAKAKTFHIICVSAS